MNKKYARALAKNAKLPNLESAANLLWQLRRYNLSDEEIGQLVNQPMQFRKINYGDYVFCEVCNTEVPRELAMNGLNGFYCSAACKDRS